MKKMIGALVVVAGIAAGAQAQTTFRIQVWNGSEWTSNLQINPTIGGGIVNVRYTASSANSEADAFAGVNFQPTVSNWSAGDAFNLGSRFGNGTGANVVDGDFSDSNAFGRVSAFAMSNIPSTNPITAHQNLVSGTNFLRIAQAAITNWVGVGAANNINNTNRGGGIAATQLGTGAPGRPATPYVQGRTDVVFYGFQIDLADNFDPRTLVLDIPGAGTNLTTGGRWYRAADTLSPSLSEAVTVVGATIEVVPTPASLALLGLGGLVAGRRRR